ncbi:hypothetical protein cypCar_00039967, partial [Cyprinus carpio]
QTEASVDNQTENIQDDVVEEFMEDTVKPKVKKKKKRKEVIVEEEQAEEKQSFDDSLVLGVYIHRTDKLKTDLMVSHPMVKVHVIDEVTGQYVKKEDSHRHVSSFYEQENIEHILPIITQPFDFKKHKITVPEWEEQIIFNERFGYFLQDDDESPRVMLFFEILDFISMEEARTNVSVDRHERGFRKIAWAFLKLVGTNGVLNVDTKLRLQLYCPPPRAKKLPQTVEVFQWWSKFPRNKYASTLYVTVKGLKPPEHVDPSIRSMMALQQERGSTSYSELNTEMTNKTSAQILESKSENIKWSRIPGQVCRIPNKPMQSFRGGQMGCFTLRFSHDGRALAAACADRDAFPIIIYEIPCGKVLASFNGHLSVVYDLCWSRDDNGLLTASSDGTVRVWNVERLQSFAHKTLPHPSFVYSAQFHPQAQSLVVTGGYDGVLRVWDVDIQDVNGQLLQEFDGHKTFINTLLAQVEVESLRGLSRSEYLDSRTGRNSSEVMTFQTPSATSMDRFSSTARVSLKMQRVKQKLDSVLGLTSYLPSPSLLSPHSKLQMSTSLSAQLIPQATLTSHSSGYSPAGQPIRRAPSLKHQKVVSLYEYRANRSDELSIRRGDVIHVLYKDNDSWWFGRLVSGQEGYFPASYVADEGSFDDELSRALEAQPSPLDQPEGFECTTPVQLSAAISASGELKIISELDTDPEASSTTTKKKKKKVKRSEVPSALPQAPSSDHEMSSASSRRRRPLPRLGQASGAFDGGPN